MQEVFAAKTFVNANYAAVISNASYTRGAKELAEKTGVLLLHYSDLRQANMLFGFSVDGVPVLQYKDGVTPPDVERARRYVTFCLIATLPLFLMGLGFDLAHKGHSSSQNTTSTITATGSAEGGPASPHDLRIDTVKPASGGGGPSSVPSAPSGKETPLKETTPSMPPPLSPESKPSEIRQITRSAPLPPELNQTFREMIIRSGRPCVIITDHIWITAAHVSLMCDRKSRVAFVQEPQGWRFARPGE